MEHLDNNNKAQFEKQINSITPKDELKVLSQIDAELDKLRELYDHHHSHKIQNLIQNAEFLLEILRDKRFPISESTRKWIVFGLGYLISEFDIIPDSIPYIGYNDDALVIQWVIYVIDKDLSRYNQYKKAEKISNESNILTEVQAGNSNVVYILVSGFINQLKAIDATDHLVSKLNEIDNDAAKPKVFVMNWPLNYLKELNDVIRIVDHQLTLKPNFDHEDIGILWQQLKLDYHLLGKTLAREIKSIKTANESNEINILAFNCGTYAVESAMQELSKSMIDKYLIFGGASSIDNLPDNLYSKIKHTYNFYSGNDFVLKFLYDNFERYSNPIGLTPFIAAQGDKITNFNKTDKIMNHVDYCSYFKELLDDAK